jgi:TATA-box binding protein (TBP), component of TFIID and TFIIIB
METLSVGEYREYLQENDVEQFDGSTVAYLDVIESINLNALMIGLGLEDVENPDQFPGVIYTLDSDSIRPTQVEFDATVILFDNGLIVTADAPDEAAAEVAVVTVAKQVDDMPLLDAEVSEKVATINPDGLPLPMDIITEW